MPTQTLAEAAKLISNPVTQGLAEDVITTNEIYQYLPWIGYEGQAVVVNREDALGDAGFFSVDDAITAKSPSSATQATFSATSIIGDVEVNGLVQVQNLSVGNNVVAHEISGKAKKVGRLFQTGMATGDGSAPNMNSLPFLVDAQQYTTAAAVGGDALTLDRLDELLDLVKAKDGQIDWIQMSSSAVRKYRSLLRALGGTHQDQVTAPDGTSMLAFNGVPVFRNDYLSTTETDNGAALTGGTQTSIYAGVWDDGSRKVGVAGIYPAAMPVGGLAFEEAGKKETKDEDVYRVKMYANFASFNRRGIARLAGVNLAA